MLKKITILIVLVCLSVFFSSCDGRGGGMCVEHVFTNECDTDCNNEGCSWTREVSHSFSHACDDRCNVVGCDYVREIAHIFDDVCDEGCNTEGCSYVRIAEHVFDGDCDSECNSCGFTRQRAHSFSNACDATCNNAGCEYTREISHIFSHDCDTDCNVEGCEATREVTHVYSSACDAVCNTAECGFVRSVADHVFSYECDGECDVLGCGFKREVEHRFANECDTSCDVELCGFTRVTEHKYSHSCDSECDVPGCNGTREITHTFSYECDALCDNPRCFYTRPVTHVFSHDCDADCNNQGCGYVRAINHFFDNDDDLICNNTQCNYVRRVGAVLVVNGEADFQIVVGEISANAYSYVEALNELFSLRGISVLVVDENAEPMDKEILIGNVSTRADSYSVDPYSLGHEGYMIKAIDDKIIITGGSEAMLINAIRRFKDDYLGSGDELTEYVVKYSDNVVVNTQNYPIKSVAVAGNSLSNYNIASDLDIAMNVRDFFYEKVGYWLPIIPENKAGDRSIIIKLVADGEAGEGGFRVRMNGTKIIIECVYSHMYGIAIESFFDNLLTMGSNVAIPVTYSYSRDVMHVYYSDFGVKGDGVSDDSLAIRAAHDFANTYDMPVLGDKDAVYRIVTMYNNGKYSAIVIKTDTDWRGAKFIIDDTHVGYIPDDTSNTEYSTDIFAVNSNYTNSNITTNNAFVKAINESGGISLDTKKLANGLGYPALLVIYDSSHKCYIRYGGNANSGADKNEIVLIDAEGNVDPSTPWLFEYSKVTKITIHRIDVKPITIKNAIFESLASKVNLIGDNKYMGRGIRINRPNVTIENLEHIITGEIPKHAVVDKDSNILEGYTRNSSTGKIYDPNGKEVTDGSAVAFVGHAFNGFINVNTTHNVLVKGCSFQGRMYYLQGTYDILITRSNAVTFKNCTQNNFFTLKDGFYIPNSGGNPCWGVSGTNYSKNFVFDGCRLTRFDAHCGVVNGKIINSSVSDVTIIGGGEMLIEDSTIYRASGAVVTLRSDYGATFRGTLKIKNVSVIDCKENGAVSSILAVNSANHWFGYTTYFPNIEIDNLMIRNAKSEIPLVNQLKLSSGTYVYRGVLDPNIHVEGAICADGKENVNPYVPPSFITIKGMENSSFVITINNNSFFKNTVISGKYKYIQ